MHAVLRATCDSQLFETTAAPYVVLDTDLHIQGVNSAYLRATRRARDDLIGAFIFDAFPDNPEDATATGVRNLNSSLERVLRRGVPDEMGVQRYDIPDSDHPGRFRTKIWSPVNTPLIDADGSVIGALHHVEDITAAQHVLRNGHGAELRDGVRQPPAVLRRAMLAIARYERACNAPTASRTTPDDLPHAAPAAPSRDTAHRDALWHRIVHAVHQAPPKSCAEAVCSATVRELSGVDAAAITLHGNGSMPYHLAVSSSLAQRGEELQWVSGEGPSLTAFETGVPALVADLARLGSSWPLFTDAACGAGVAAVFAYPLRSTCVTLGTLTLYRGRRAVDAAGPPAGAEACAEIATVVLLADLDTEITERLRATTDADDINTAIGVLAAVRGVSTHEAARMLRATAQSKELPLADVARALLLRYLPGGPGDPS
ncbi:hypothetical protein GCM10010361_12050 [Streptomyces olivaceiscleroticus]|uniref:ANTAR domain-containing protein n=1 Tax=Streptomyces olivaceiscleroticus TaxID=68245 RepID=A0ABN0ZJ05_9ACTN